MCSRGFRGVFRCLGTLSECACVRQCEQVRTCACVRVEWVCVCTLAMLLDQGVLCFFLPPTTPNPCPGLHPGLSFSPNPTNWRGPILQMKKMPPGPWPPASWLSLNSRGCKVHCHAVTLAGPRAASFGIPQAAVGVGGLCSPWRLWPGPPPHWSLGLAGVLREPVAQNLLPGLLPHLHPPALCGSPLGMRQKASWPGQFAPG